MKLITFDDKESTKTSTKPRKNCIIDQDINDLKEAINENANINTFGSTEEVIGKWGNKDLYRNKITINKSAMSISSNRYDLDIESLGAEQVFVDMTHSYFYEIINDNIDYYLHRPFNFIRFPNVSTLTNLKKETLAILDWDQTMISFWIGDNVNFDKLVLYIEYTKGE